MANPAYGKCYPFENVDQQARETEWRHYGGAFGDGIVGPPRADGKSAFSIIPSASDRTLVLTLADFRMRGIMFEPTQDTISLTVPAIASDQVRTDRLLARFDPVGKNITFYIRAGEPVATSATPVRPSFSRAAGGVWEIGLWVWTGGNVAANQLAFEDQRIFLGDIMHGNTAPGQNTELNLGRPDGSRFYHLPTGEEYVQSYPGGVATWTNIDNPAWSPLSIGGQLKAGIRAPQYRLCRGHLEMQGEVMPKTGVWSGVGDKYLGQLPTNFAERVGFMRRFPIALTSVSDTTHLIARARIDVDGSMSYYLPAGITAGGACYDNISLPLEA